MADGMPAHAGPRDAAPGRRARIVALAMALAGVVASEATCHEEHEIGQDCAVCQLRHQPAA